MLTAVALAVMACVANAADPKPSGAWRIEFNHVADNDGAIVLRIAPANGSPVEVETKIPANTSENSVAQLVSDSLKAALGTKNFRIGVDDGEDVIVKKRGKTKNFQVTMVSTSLTGLEIKIRHE